MHPNPTFRRASAGRNIAFARARGFGTLAASGPEGPLLAHVPFLLSGDGLRAELHMVRSNPLVATCASRLDAVMAVQGPDAYVSPDWYGAPDQVPTWNYVAVHLRGTLVRLPQETLRPMLDRLSEHFEERLAPKPVWQSHKMTPEALERLLRQVVPFELRIRRIEGTWKLGQNKTAPQRQGAAAAMAEDGIGMETDALAQLMREAE
jgi:transcriptional regulator